MKRRIVIIGCGGMARVHARELQDFDRFTLVAASDPMEPARAAMEQAVPSLKLYEDTGEMLAKEKPELAIVATRAPAHAELSMQALRAGAHVLCEKPLTVTVAEADRMLETAREVGRMVLVDHQFRINPRVQGPLRMAQRGDIGPIRWMFCVGKGRYGGWELVETGTHLFDLALLFGGEAEWVAGHMLTGERLATADDILDVAAAGPTSGPVVGERAHVSIGFGNGAVLRCDLVDAASTNFLQVMGTKGLLHVPLGVAAAKPWHYPKPFINPNNSEGWQEVPVEWGRWGERHNLYAYDLWAQWLDDPGARPMEVDGRHPMDAEFGRQSMEIIHGAFESHFQGGARVKLPLARRDHPLTRLQRRRERAPQAV